MRAWRLAVVAVSVGGVIMVALAVWVGVPLAAGRKPYRVPSASMEPTIGVGEHIVVSRRAYDDRGPQVGDIIVFHPPAGADANICGARDKQPDQPCGKASGGRADVSFVKRVVAVGGDTVAIRGGHVVRNGRRPAEPFIRPCDGGTGCDFPRPTRVPRGEVFTLGDNRGESDDSRFWGPVPVGWIVGRVDRCGLLKLSCHARRG